MHGTASKRLTSSVVAMIVVAVIAVFQTGVIFYSVNAQRDMAHILDIGGSQRNRTQRLAYFALSLTTAYPAAHAKDEIAATIRDMRRTRAEIAKRRPDGRARLGELSEQYFASVAAVVRHPHDPHDIREMERLRPIVFDAFDAAAKRRVSAASQQTDRNLAMLLVGLLLQIASICAVWFRIVAPSEQKRRRLLLDVQQARQEIESTFEHNPDVIAIYDRDGYLVRENAARKALLGAKRLRAARQHFSSFAHAHSQAAVREAFARALSGSAVRAEVQLLSAEDRPIDVASTFYPYLVRGVPSGVTIVSKDVRQMRALEESNAEQAQRLTDLYQIATATGRTTNELLDSAIALLTARLGYDGGVITEIVGNTVTVISTTRGLKGLAVGDTRPLETSMVRLALDAPDVYEDRNFFASAYGGVAIALNWQSVCGMKIFADGIVYGTIGFSSERQRLRELTDADVSFMRLACALLGAIIERGRQMTRLDALAHFDPLTGLANRARFASQIEALIASKRRFALHYIDLDRFKKINDRYGHSAGDAVLKIAAKRLQRCARAEDMVVRLGGDEFAILQTVTTGRLESAQLAKRVVDAFSEPIDLGGIVVEVGASVGIAIRPRSAVEARALIEAADAALYAAKRNGRGRFAHASNSNGAVADVSHVSEAKSS